MRSFTDTFIKHPVLAAVVNLVIVLVGWRAITTLPVQQYPKIESSSVLITTDRKSTRLNSSHGYISYAVFCLKKKKIRNDIAGDTYKLQAYRCKYHTLMT